jgi:hypothetical protein
MGSNGDFIQEYLHTRLITLKSEQLELGAPYGAAFLLMRGIS